jgi:hypothetical protein
MESNCGDFLRLLAFTRAPEKESLSIQWPHVDFAGKRILLAWPKISQRPRWQLAPAAPRKIVVRALSILTRNLNHSCVNSRRALDSRWLFPSPRRGERDIPAKTLRESFKLVAQKAELPNVFTICGICSIRSA